MKLLLIDRDNTILECPKYEFDPEKARFMKNTVEYLKQDQKTYDKILIVSQSEGDTSRETFQLLEDAGLEREKFWFISTSNKRSSVFANEFRERVKEQFGIDNFSEVLMVGDQMTDYIFAQNIGAQFESAHDYFLRTSQIDVFFGYTFNTWFDFISEFYPWHIICPRIPGEKSRASVWTPLHIIEVSKNLGRNVAYYPAQEFTPEWLEKWKQRRELDGLKCNFIARSNNVDLENFDFDRTYYE